MKTSSTAVHLLLCLALFAALFAPSPAQADPPAPPVDPQGASSPLPAEEQESLQRFWQANPQRAGGLSGYYTLPGVAFQPRASTVKLSYYAGGCVYASGSASGESSAFTAPVNLQQGATILGMRFFGYDAQESADMQLALTAYDGAGAQTARITISTSGAPGAVSQYVALASPFIVDSENEALSMVWSRAAQGTLLRLCSAQIFYVPPEPPYFSGSPSEAPAGAPSAAMTRYYYTFTAGQDFLPRDSATAYDYAGHGCITTGAAGTVVSDLDLPDGATLIGARVYFNDTSAAAGLTFNLSTFDGKGGSAALLEASNGSASGGFSDLYQPLTAPYAVDQEAESMLLSAQLPGGPDVALCGARLYWSLPDYPGASQPAAAPEPDLPAEMSAVTYHYRNIAGAAFQPRAASTAYAYDEAGCVHITGGTTTLTADLHLPPGSDLWGVRLFTYDTAGDATTPLDSTLVVTEYDNGGGNKDFIFGKSEGSAGYGDLFYFPNTPHLVDSARSLALVWDSGGVTNNTMRLCGMRVYYKYSGASGRIYLPMLMR